MLKMDQATLPKKVLEGTYSVLPSPESLLSDTFGSVWRGVCKASHPNCVYATLMFLIGGASGYGIHRYWVSPSLTPLQRVYFKQYLKSTYRVSARGGIRRMSELWGKLRLTGCEPL